MVKFKISSMTVDYYEEHIEADNEDEAKEAFEQKLENGDLQPKDGYVFYEEDEEFEPIDSVVRVEDDDLGDEEDEEDDFDEI